MVVGNLKYYLCDQEHEDNSHLLMFGDKRNLVKVLSMVTDRYCDTFIGNMCSLVRVLVPGKTRGQLILYGRRSLMASPFARKKPETRTRQEYGLS